jgi:predicted transcriptional regulator
MSRMNSTAQTLSSANSASAISVTSDIKTAIDSLKRGNSKDAIMHLNQAVEHFSK